MGQVPFSVAVTQLPLNLCDTIIFLPSVKHSAWSFQPLKLESYTGAVGLTLGRILNDEIESLAHIESFWHVGFSYNFSSYELEQIYLLNL